MLTSYQSEIIAYLADGALYCAECGAAADEEVMPLIRYSVEEEWPEGAYCDGCGETIADPDPEYCVAHQNWATRHDDYGRPVACDQNDGDDCIFVPAEPNPPAARWVPCGACGARDGEPHRDGCIRIPGGEA